MLGRHHTLDPTSFHNDHGFGLGVEGLGFRGLGFRGLGFRGSGFRSLGLGFRGYDKVTCGKKSPECRALAYTGLSQPSVLSRTYSRLSALGGSGDLVSKVTSTLVGVISNYKYSSLSYNPSY